MWNSGITCNDRSAAVRASDSAMPQAERARFRWRSGTILGLDVVPEVCRTRATSSGDGPFGAEGSGAGEEAIRSIKPEPPEAEPVSATGSTPASAERAASRASEPDSSGRVMSALAPRSSR